MKDLPAWKAKEGLLFRCLLGCASAAGSIETATPLLFLYHDAPATTYSE